MDFKLQQMTVEDYAASQLALGHKITRIGNFYWRRIRPLFFRPLLPQVEFSPSSIKKPFSANFGGVQYAVPEGHSSNSTMSFIMFENITSYSINNISYNTRRKIKTASKHLAVKKLLDFNHLKNDAHAVYLSFYERSQYTYKAERTDKAVFDSWVDALIQAPKTNIIGIYDGDALKGICISYWVDDVLHYNTTFCSSDVLQFHAPSLLLHAALAAAAATGKVHRVLATTYKGGDGIDKFYLERGGLIINKPAMLEINPLAAYLIKFSGQKYHEKLYGRS